MKILRKFLISFKTNTPLNSAAMCDLNVWKESVFSRSEDVSRI
jgi:hypothetical protein